MDLLVNKNSKLYFNFILNIEEPSKTLSNIEMQNAMFFLTNRSEFFRLLIFYNFLNTANDVISSKLKINISMI